jgi:hypothetical protein
LLFSGILLVIFLLSSVRQAFVSYLDAPLNGETVSQTTGAGVEEE